MVIRVRDNKIMVPLIKEELKCVYCNESVLDVYGIGVESKSYLTRFGIVCSDCFRSHKCKIFHVYKPGEYPYLCIQKEL